MEALGRLTPKPEYLGDEEQAREFLRYAMKFPEFSFDVESTGKDTPWADQAVFVGLAAGNRRACLPIVLLSVLRPLMEHPTMLKACHAIKGDVRWIANANVGISVTDPLIDTVTMSVREHSDRPNHQLKFLISDGLFTPTDDRYMKYPSFSDLYNPKDYLREMLRLDNRDKVTDYCSADAWAHLIVFQELRKRLKALPAFGGRNMWQLFLELEVPLTRVLYDYERTGFPLDVDYLGNVRTPINHDYENLVKEIAMETGTPINPMSNPQVAELLFSKLGYQPVKYTPGGRKGIRVPSVDEKVLKTLIAKGGKNVEVVRKILNCHGLSKVRGTYVDGMIKKVSPYGRIHTTLNQGVAETGRLSSSDPNLQNLPARPEKLGAKYTLRKAFRAPEGWSVVDYDFDQVEMKLMAAMGPDEVMLQMINSGKDIHCFTAERVFKHGSYDEYVAAKQAKQKTEAQEKLMADRYRSKTTGFGIAYGQTPYGLSEQLQEPKEACQKYIEEWLAVFPGIVDHIERSHGDIQRLGYIETILGWRRYLPAGKLEHWDSPDRHDRDGEFKKAMRAGYNAIIQGCLQDSARIHTDRGYIKISDIPENRATQVWTGSAWAPFTLLDMGPCQTAEIELDDGVILPCDTRHNLLRLKGDNYSWASYESLSVGDTIACPLVQATNFYPLALSSVDSRKRATIHCKMPLTPTAEADFWYWLGYYYGDGWVGREREIIYSFGEDELPTAGRCAEYWASWGVHPHLRTMQRNGRTKDRYGLNIHSIELLSWLQTLGVEPADAHTKRLPRRVFQESLSHRKAFMAGLFDADGYNISTRKCPPNLHLCQRPLLQDVKLLLRDMGIESRIHGPYEYKGFISYRLDIPRQMYEFVFGGSQNKHRVQLRFPVNGSVRRELRDRYGTTTYRHFSEWSLYVLWKRFIAGGFIGPYTLRDLLAAMNWHLDQPLYAPRAVTRKTAQKETRNTYTLSVEDPLHRFDAEGVINKNSAADAMKCALIRVHFDKELRQHGFVPCMTVHDEGLGFAPKEEAEWCLKRCCELATDPLAMFGVELPVKITASGGFGPNWYEAKD